MSIGLTSPADPMSVGGRSTSETALPNESERRFTTTTSLQGRDTKSERERYIVQQTYIYSSHAIMYLISAVFMDKSAYSCIGVL